MATWSVQTKGEDGLFRTVEDGEHAHLSTAYWHYKEVADTGAEVAMLLRGAHVIERSDDVELAGERPAESLL